MKQHKYVLNRFSFYDRSGMESWLEKMASRGWMLKERTSWFWIFSRSEPKKVRYSLIYSSTIDDDSIFSTQNQIELMDLCKVDGWNHGAGYLQMQFFWTDDSKAEPLLTDPEADLDTLYRIHTNLFRKQIAMILLLGLAALAGILAQIADFCQSPLELLLDPERLLYPLGVLTLFVAVLIQPVWFHLWYKRAKKAVRQGTLPGSASSAWRITRCLVILLIIPMLLLVIQIFVYGSNRDRVEYALGILICLLAFAIGAGLYWLLRRISVSRKTASTAVAITMMLLFLIYIPIISGNADRLQVLDHSYCLQIVDGKEHQLPCDPLPITANELYGVGGIRKTQADYNRSPFASSLWCSDFSVDRSSDAFLFYRVYQISASSVYAATLDRELHPFYYDGLRTDYVEEFPLLDPAPWGADAAYGGTIEGNTRQRVVLCYGDRIVFLECRPVLTPEQMMLFGERISIAPM